MRFRDIQRRQTTRQERPAVRAEYESWRRGDVLVNGWTWKRWRKWAYGSQRGKYFYCGKKTARHAMQVDHRVAVYYGSPNDVDNFVLACRPCSRFKAQHVLLRKNDRSEKALTAANVIVSHRADYKRQEQAYADAMNGLMGDACAMAIQLDS